MNNPASLIQMLSGEQMNRTQSVPGSLLISYIHILQEFGGWENMW